MMQDQAWRLHETCAHIKEMQPFELEGMLTGSTGKNMAVTLKFRWGLVSLPAAMSSTCSLVQPYCNCSQELKPSHQAASVPISQLF